MEFDPRLRITPGEAYDIEAAISPVFETVTIFMSECYSFPLAAEVRGEEILVRAATGGELLTQGDLVDPERIDWPGDPASPTGHEIVWQEAQSDEPRVEDGCRLWAGEVILSARDGLAGPFYVHELAARAWAFSTALGLPERDVLEAQVVPYACAGSSAPALISDATLFRRFNRCWESPVRPWGQVEVLRLRTGAGDSAVEEPNGRWP